MKSVIVLVFIGLLLSLSVLVIFGESSGSRNNSLTTTTQSGESGAVASLVGNFVSTFDAMNATGLESFYTNSSVVSWRGDSGGFSGTYHASNGDIGLLYKAVFGLSSWIHATPSNLSIASVAPGTTNATFRLLLNGSLVIYGRTIASVIAQQEWVKQERETWRIQRETWKFLSLYTQVNPQIANLAAIYGTTPVPPRLGPKWVIGELYGHIAGAIGESCVTDSGFIYCIAGYDAYEYYRGDYFAQLQPTDGGTGGWTLTTPYPLTTEGESCVAYSGYVLCVGGNANYSSPTKATFMAPLSHREGIGEWTTTPPYPIPVSQASCVVTGKPFPNAGFAYVFCIGGHSEGNSTNKVYYTELYPNPLGAGGGLGYWNSTVPYPIGIESESCVPYLNYIYCINGAQSTSLPGRVYYVKLSDAGGIDGQWIETMVYPVGAAGSSCVVNQNIIYCIGGGGGIGGECNCTSEVQVNYAKISGNGGIDGRWNLTTLFPGSLYAYRGPRSYYGYIGSEGCVVSYGTIYCLWGNRIVYDQILAQDTPVVTVSVTTSVTKTLSVPASAGLNLAYATLGAGVTLAVASVFVFYMKRVQSHSSFS